MPMPAIKQTMGALEWAMLLTLSLVWGSSFFLFEIAITALPTLSIVLLRVALGTAALWAVVLLLGHGFPRSPLLWRRFLAMGLLNNAIPFTLIVWGQREIASGLAAILNATIPFFTILIANAFTRDEKLTLNRLVGVCVGLAGVAVMIGIDLVASFGTAVLAQLAVLAASASYAIATVYGRRFAETEPIVTAAGQTAGSTLLLLPLVLLIDRPWTLAVPPLHVWAAMAALALLCTSFAYVLYFAILRRAGATNLALVTFLVPVGAIALGILFLDENLYPRHIFGMAAIGVGLALIDGRPFRAMLRQRAA